MEKQSPPANNSDNASKPDETFQMTKMWLIVGLLAILVGIASGFIMSGFTFAR